MSKKLFVGGLNFSTDEIGLRQTFEGFGEIEEVKLITDRDTGKSRGFGFITFSEMQAADDAISQLDGTELDGRTIKVNEAQDKRRDNRRDGGGYGRNGGGYGRRSGGSRW